MHPTVRNQIKLWGFTPKRHLGEARPWWLDWLLKAWDGKSVSHAFFLWIPSSCGFQILAQDEKFLSPPLPVLGCVFSLLDTFCWAEDIPFGKLYDHHEPSRNAKWIFSDKGQSGKWGRHPPNLWLLLPFSTCLSLSPNSVTIKRDRLGTPYQEDAFPGNICSS